jgi:magnesium transporter
MPGSRRNDRPDSAPAVQEAFALTDDLLHSLRRALDDNSAARIEALLDGLHSADVADLIHQIGRERRKRLVENLKSHLDPEILSELDDGVRQAVVKQLGPAHIAAALAGLDTDDATEVLETLDQATQASVLTALDEDERTPIEEALAYPEDSAGRLMQRDLVAIPDFWTIGQTIDFLREATDLPDEFYEIIVVDPSHHPIGTLPLYRAMRMKRPIVIGDIMDADPHLIPVLMDQEEVAYVFEQYNVPSAAVIDNTGRLLGVIMVDDVVDIILEEAEEDIMRLGGISESNLYDSVFETTRQRFPWLLVNLATAVMASGVIAFFEATIEQIVALAVLMPIVASMGGNAGTQTLTITVRALATRDLTRANALRLLNKEFAVSIANGFIFAVITGVVAWVWFGSQDLGIVIFAAMVINIIVAGVAGMLIPLGLNRIGIDPALAATVFVTTITDVLGFSAFLGLAAWFLL